MSKVTKKGKDKKGKKEKDQKVEEKKRISRNNRIWKILISK